MSIRLRTTFNEFKRGRDIDANSVRANSINVDDIRTSTDVGTSPVTGAQVVERGDPYHHVTTITFLEAFTVGTITGAAAQAVGVLIYTFPTGKVVVHGSSDDVSLTYTSATNNAVTTDIGMGSGIGTGAIATLGAGTDLENILAGSNPPGSVSAALAVADDRTGGAGTGLINGSAFLNVAATWGAADTLTAAAASRVVLEWSFYPF